MRIKQRKQNGLGWMREIHFWCLKYIHHKIAKLAEEMFALECTFLSKLCFNEQKIIGTNIFMQDGNRIKCMQNMYIISPSLSRLWDQKYNIFLINNLVK